MNKEQKRYIKEIKALMPVYGKYEERFFHDIKDSICELAFRQSVKKPPKSL